VTHVIRSYTTTFAYRDECGRKVQRAQYGKGFQRPSISSALFCQFCHDLALPSGMVGYVPQDFNVFMQCSNISCETLVITVFKNSEELRRIVNPNPSGSWTFLDSQGLKCPWIAQECWQHFFGEFLAVLNARLVLTIDSSPWDPACC